MGTQKTQQMHYEVCKEKGAVRFRPPIDWVYLACILFIDCKHNTSERLVI